MRKRAFLICFASSLILALTLSARARAKEKVLYQFTGGVDGGGPSSSLVMDASGNLYGTTYNGGSATGSCGSSGCGVVFELTRSGSDWKESVLYAFQGVPDGAFPGGNLLFDTSGNLYGTTSRGGAGTNCQSDGCGTIFELSPHSGSWTEIVLYSFKNTSDGAFPAGLTFDASANLYGTTGSTFYELSPSKQPGSGWTEHTFYNFGEGTPNPGLIFDGEGNLYGTYYDLDIQFCNPNIGCGAVFELKHAHRQWRETDLYDFLGDGNGGQPAAGVIRDSKGNLYGTGAQGGNNFGIVFELTHAGGQWKESLLYNFCSRDNCSDGAFPLAGLVMDGNGVLYGTTDWGGKCLYCGVVFKLAHTMNGWKETVLYGFESGNGPGPSAESLILDARGNLYGTAGSTSVNGLVFEVTQ
jgi:uncharacterized repeat protein (TIGR03803 family)